MEELNRASKIYGRNFFRLTLPFIVYFGSSIACGTYLFPRGQLTKLLCGLLLGLFGLLCTSGSIIDSWGALNNRQFSFREAWNYILHNFHLILPSIILAIVPWLLLLYLFLNFLSFFLFVPLAVYPFFFIYLLPSILLGRNGSIAAIKESIQIAWSHSTRTVLLTYLPGLLVIGLISIGVYSPIVLVITPAWIVLVTTNYCNYDQHPGPIIKHYNREVN